MEGIWKGGSCVSVWEIINNQAGRGRAEPMEQKSFGLFDLEGYFRRVGLVFGECHQVGIAAVKPIGWNLSSRLTFSCSLEQPPMQIGCELFVALWFTSSVRSCLVSPGLIEERDRPICLLAEMSLSRYSRKICYLDQLAARISHLASQPHHLFRFFAIGDFASLEQENGLPPGDRDSGCLSVYCICIDWRGWCTHTFPTKAKLHSSRCFYFEKAYS